MGLDMFAYARRTAPATPVDFKTMESDGFEEIAYWRKHPNLHGWMERLYREKGGTKESFNCAPVALTATDLDALEETINNDALPTTTGFFFATTRPEEKHLDVTFIAKARREILDGKTVYYTSWW